VRKAFLDTNVLVYAHDRDRDQPAKQTAARNLLRDLSAEFPPCISTQVLQEFFVTATKKTGITPIQAKQIIRSFRHMEIVVNTPDEIAAAIDNSVSWKISFWDALILTSADKARCSVLYSEDLNHGQFYGAVRVLNPFL
jgi:predicted nucleic acid-binding protein